MMAEPAIGLQVFSLMPPLAAGSHCQLGYAVRDPSHSGCQVPVPTVPFGEAGRGGP